MDSKLTSALTILCTAITAVVSTYVLVGPGWAFGLGIVSTIAFIGWLGVTRTNRAEPLAGPYLLAIVAVLTVSTCRYFADYVPQLAADFGAWFLPDFPIRAGVWFFIFVSLPVMTMSFGGYFLIKRTPLGVYMAWWTAIYVVADGLFQLRLETMSGTEHLYFLTALAGVLEIVVGVMICQRLLGLRAADEINPPARALTATEINLWSLGFLVATAIYAYFIDDTSGPLPLVIVIGSMLGGLIGWRLTTALKPADPAKAVPLYLLLLAFFYLHVGEEGLAGFATHIAAISGKPWSEGDFLVLFGLVGPVVWFFSAWSLWKRQPFGNFIFWFLIVGMILGEPTHHLVFPVMAMAKLGVGYTYFPGMYSALFPMLPAILALVMIVGERKRATVAA
jgi:hypothetical protein